MYFSLSWGTNMIGKASLKDGPRIFCENSKSFVNKCEPIFKVLRSETLYLGTHLNLRDPTIIIVPGDSYFEANSKTTRKNLTATL